VWKLGEHCRLRIRVRSRQNSVWDLVENVMRHHLGAIDVIWIAAESQVHGGDGVE
jgi:hypothetical protein